MNANDLAIPYKVQNRADLLLHVIDVSHPQCDPQIEAVNSVVSEIGAEGKPTLMVLNKIDRAEK